ncbi:MarR family transcriptional regulator [Prosthecomicrobium hirschii]|uniref:MarR family winged helix-turn-helix transcriptional regulator n=1 Tax=Prosthecodimorpha hirschii TaxID=665126 RepID=UPI00112B9443|nr:MarR family transcriptional regulator [Prosthecomicrobium hirschii]TPQ46538.1 MarR family transcriptional regulator [Prosthecomicrobium hirschii]
MDTPPRLEDQICFALYGALQAMTRAYKPLLEPLGLTYPQYLVMLVLWERDGLSVGEIGDRLGLDSGTLTPLLKRLEGAGYLKRSRDKADERVVRVVLSRAGDALRGPAADAVRAIGCLIGQPAGDLAALRDGIKALKASLSK